MSDKSSISELRLKRISEHTRDSIGTYKERTQHLMLKNYFEPDVKYHEVPVGKYIADICNSKGICEIQTSGFDKMKSKLEAFLLTDAELISVVYPCSSEKRVCWCDTETGAVSEGYYRKYPKAKYRLLSELFALKDLFGEEKLNFMLCEVRASDIRLLDGYGESRKKRATKADTQVDEVLIITDIKSNADIRKLLPFNDGDILTSDNISKALGLTRRSLWRALKFLLCIGILSEFGKRGRAILYKVCSTEH